MTPRPRGLYLITPDDRDTDRLLERVSRVIDTATWLQYRNKAAGPGLRRDQASALARLCRDAAVPLVINDDPVLAREVGAAGVHLGEDDGEIATARALLGADAIIGISCYDRMELAEQAVRAGADYVAFGAFFPSTSKARTRRATPDLLESARALGVPIVAIGGITADNAGLPAQAGADLLAVIAGVFSAPDPRAAALAVRDSIRSIA